MRDQLSAKLSCVICCIYPSAEAKKRRNTHSTFEESSFSSHLKASTLSKKCHNLKKMLSQPFWERKWGFSRERKRVQKPVRVYSTDSAKKSNKKTFPSVTNVKSFLFSRKRLLKYQNALDRVLKWPPLSEKNYGWVIKNQLNVNPPEVFLPQLLQIWSWQIYGVNKLLGKQPSSRATASISWDVIF